MGDLLIEVCTAEGQGIYPQDLKPAKPALENFRERAADIGGGIADAAGELKRQFDAALGKGKGLAPDQVEIAFGLDVQAGTNVVVARASTGCTFTVRLTWARHRDDE
jgi:hypothetical protein